MNYNLVFDTVFEKEQIGWENGTKTVYDIYSCCRHPNIGFLPGVIVPVFIEFTDFR